VIAIDASVVIALLDSGDAHHSRAVSLMHSHAGDGFLIHPITLAEVLVGAARNGRGAQRLAELTSIGISTADGDPTEPLFLAELRATTGLPLPDCCVLSIALRAETAIATFDARLGRVATEAGLRVVD
jgi:predicted nucleic acid-binding protein